MRNALKLNLAIVTLYFVSHLLSLIGFPYISFIAGALVFFLPGLNIALAFEQITNMKQGKILLLLWAYIIGLILTPAVIYSIILLRGVDFNLYSTLSSLGIWLITSLIFYLLIFFWKKNPISELKVKAKDFSKHKFLFISLGISVFLLVINFSLYSFLPEADPYTYLVKLDTIGKTGNLAPDSRSLFLSFCWSFSSITSIPSYHLFKIVVPFLGLAMPLTAYLFARKILPKQNLLLILCTLTPFLFPIITVEALITRPQSLFFFTLAPFVYLTSQLLKKRDNLINAYWLLLLILLTLIGVKIHEFFLFLIVTELLAALYFFWPKAKRYPLESLIVLAFLIFSTLPWLKDSGILPLFNWYIRIFTQHILHPNIDLWFIDHYTNADGNQVGWPGISQIYYYGYNLGIAPLIFIALWIWKKARVNFNFAENWLYLFVFAIFFSVAEVFPRLGFAYLPDRAWLFVSLMLCFFIPHILKALWPKNLSVKVKLAIIFLIGFSILIPASVTYFKQGWVTKEEYKSVKFIENQTPENAIFISQGGNKQLIEYFAERTINSPSDAFFLSSVTDNNYINSVEMTDQNDMIKDIKKNLINDLSDSANNISNNQINQELENIKSYIVDYQEKLKYATENKAVRPVYILYSENKFKSLLYGKRSWWRSYNYYGADLNKFNNSPLFSKVYNSDGVTIWKYSK
ncbi:MAG: hypothetical protein WC107_00380 [Patescibacteria group bacterium]